MQGDRPHRVILFTITNDEQGEVMISCILKAGKVFFKVMELFFCSFALNTG